MTDQQNDTLSPTPDSALARLAALAGEWDVEGMISGRSTGHARTVFEPIEGGAFLKQRTSAAQADFPSSTVIIGCDDARDSYSTLYSDSRGIVRVYQMSFDGHTWKQWREAPGFSQRFSATLSADGKTMRGAWEKSLDDATWEHDFDLT